MILDVVAFLKEAANQGVRIPLEREDGSVIEPPVGGTTVERVEYYRKEVELKD